MTESDGGTVRAALGNGASPPLSTAQLRWWVDQQLHPDLPIRGAMYQDISGPVDIGLLRECSPPAARELEPLKRSFQVLAGQPRQYLAAEADCRIGTLDPPTGSPTVLLPELLRAGPVPDAVALRDGGRTMTYRELDEESSRWARELLAGGAGPGEFLVVAVPRSVESVLALWAVAKTGACFVPIDPAEPARRIARVIADSGARQGITVSAAMPDLPRSGIEWLLLDDAAAAGRAARRAADPVDNVDRARALRPGHPAYLVYTSATTGTPKGVVVTHRGLAPLTGYIADHYGVHRDSVILREHAPSFDAHLLELFSAFAVGAPLVVEPPSVMPGR
ncbi:AMP-binding protein [Nocardia sp. CA-119907]|uniref:AMP-binding protein n=1 Tax=Nocardia sp. CA-119907 TaxID=3239973 RepID=UPI003D95286D